jgi:hypothetical protein
MYLLSLLSASVVFSSVIVGATVLDAHSNPLVLRQTNNEQAYLNSVCQPNVTNPVPPCQEIINIQSACLPNGTEPVDYIAHQECMCDGGFFSNWIGCLNCLYVHGGRSPSQSAAFSQILTSASNILCTGTPTTDFAAIFSSLSDASVSVPSTVGTGMTDLYPSQTAVSLYYTASGPQGEGAITGSATLATQVPSTAAASTTAAGSAATGGASGLTSAAGSGAGSASAASKTSSSGAAATNGLAGLLGVVAGGVVVAAL